jgi:hypothetical protein
MPYILDLWMLNNRRQRLQISKLVDYCKMAFGKSPAETTVPMVPRCPQKARYRSNG